MIWLSAELTEHRENPGVGMRCSSSVRKLTEVRIDSAMYTPDRRQS